MRKFNCHGNTDETNFSVLWIAASLVIDMDTGTGDHQRRHTELDKEKTNNFSYAPNVLSVQELVDKEKELLPKTDGKKQGVDFLVPYLLWVYLQLPLSHENRKTAERYTGEIPFKHMILSRTNIYSAHLHAHWVVVLKKYFRHHASHLCRLIVNALEMAEEKCGVDIKTLLPHSDVIVYLGQDDKASVTFGRLVPLAAVGKKSAR